VSFGQAGAPAALELARTDRVAVPRRGFRVAALASAYPGIWDADGPFANAEARVNAHFPLFGPAHLALRPGGAAAGRDLPMFSAAFIGGRHSLRGYRSGRFAGDLAVFSGAELRVPLGTAPLLVRGDIGVFGLVDAGRVWHDGDSPGGWHTGYGA